MAEFTINGKPVIAADIQKKIAKNADLEMRLSRAAQFVRHGGLMWRIVGWLIDGIDETPPQDLASEIGKIFSALVERPAIGKCSGNP